jgi:hypothetical protein
MGRAGSPDASTRRVLPAIRKRASECHWRSSIREAASVFERAARENGLVVSRKRCEFVRVRPERQASQFRDFPRGALSEFGCAFSKAPTAVPPIARSYRPGRCPSVAEHRGRVGAPPAGHLQADGERSSIHEARAVDLDHIGEPVGFPLNRLINRSRAGIRASATREARAESLRAQPRSEYSERGRTRQQDRCRFASNPHDRRPRIAGRQTRWPAMPLARPCLSIRRRCRSAYSFVFSLRRLLFSSRKVRMSPDASSNRTHCS